MRGMASNGLAGTNDNGGARNAPMLIADEAWTICIADLAGGSRFKVFAFTYLGTYYWGIYT
jgi:hypothetical protein|tara:strand:+ start:256 stop:438 length:183 start_codon:yes stop_codon:yes gene_type:complete